MKRLQQLFSNKSTNILNVYVTAGYPQLESTLEVMKALQDYGADMIELGMPYSDPMADGETIQNSSSIAIANGMTIKKLFKQLQDFRDTIHIPVVLMGYLNPVMQYGFEKFCSDAAALGIDGLILPDMPEHAFETQYQPVIKEYGLDFIFLVAPETSEERVRKLDVLSSGFLYAVSSSSLTGTDKNFDVVNTYLQRLENYHLQNPVLVGFGIKDKQTFQAACAHTQGAIIGSAYIKALEKATAVKEATRRFLQDILN